MQFSYSQKIHPTHMDSREKQYNPIYLRMIEITLWLKVMVRRESNFDKRSIGSTPPWNNSLTLTRAIRRRQGGGSGLSTTTRLSSGSMQMGLLTRQVIGLEIGIHWLVSQSTKVSDDWVRCVLLKRVDIFVLSNIYIFIYIYMYYVQVVVLVHYMTEIHLIKYINEKFP